MNLSLTQLKTALVLSALFHIQMIDAQEVTELAPPPYDISDPAGVNLLSGQVSPSLTDISIGEDRGLTHTISAYTSNFVNSEAPRWGFSDNFRGGIYKTELKQDGDPANWHYVMRVYDGSTTVDFNILASGQYEALRNKRFELRWVPGTGFVFTKPDGTEVIYGLTLNPGVAPEEVRAMMSEIRYPNGFRVNISGAGVTAPIYSVSTNTGYQLKYHYQSQSLTLSPDKVGNTSTKIPEASAYWYQLLPREIIGLNNAFHSCPTNSTQCTGIDASWPKTIHQWPNGMPREMHIGDSVFKVTNHLGQTTEFHHTAIDGAVFNGGNMVYQPPGYRYVPRFSRIVYPDGKIYSYEYENVGALQCLQGTEPFCLPTWWMSKGTAVIKSARLNGSNQQWSYSIGNQQSINSVHSVITGIYNASSGYRAVNYVRLNPEYQEPYEVDTWNTLVRQKHVTENPWEFRTHTVQQKIGGSFIEYAYDSRGNVNWQKQDGIVTETEYPDCTSENRKYCNKPTWYKDANGNVTEYTYHAPSGQIASITQPAVNGIRPQTRYTYEQYRARYKNSSGTWIDGSPIWLKASESHCIHSNHNGSNCEANDEVTTSYEYEHNNLHLTGVVVRAVNSAGNVETRRTCFQYDKLGRKISETAPRANLTSCPQ